MLRPATSFLASKFSVQVVGEFKPEAHCICNDETHSNHSTMSMLQKVIQPICFSSKLKLKKNRNTSSDDFQSAPSQHSSPSPNHRHRALPPLGKRRRSLSWMRCPHLEKWGMSIAHSPKTSERMSHKIEKNNAILKCTFRYSPSRKTNTKTINDLILIDPRAIL